ncbi:hypothetical protein [Actinomadura rayongensis]|uniref:Uncharacterized protein n=1 Tax=Actinomadura rayongensis TaxID=1429076 RepID=A0A6I4W2A5_9ACTN|nr:hypothetical protein [Actinomadura rayongensis]MXQ64317.1 hypothetical protein [Actinomadura rayongensis]
MRDQILVLLVLFLISSGIGNLVGSKGFDRPRKPFGVVNLSMAVMMIAFRVIHDSATALVVAFGCLVVAVAALVRVLANGRRAKTEF